MKIGAGIAGILLGIFSLTYVGLFGGMMGVGAGWLGSLGPQGNSISNWAGMISTLSWLSPLLAIVGGIITFSSPRFGGGILAASAFTHWYLLGFSTIGNLFVLPLGAAALLAFFAAPSTPTSTPLGATTATSSQSNNGSIATAADFDRAKWNALLQYDKDIALMTERLQQLGQKWVDKFASSYLALNDKTYLPEIERKIVAAAKAEEEQNERQRIQAEEQRRAFLQEQERCAQARKKKLELWRVRVWGNSKRKLLTVTCGVVVVLLATVALWPKKYTDSIGMKFILIPAGSFMMGSPMDEPERGSGEIQHRVTISRPYYLQTTEVTQGQWKAVMGNNPSQFNNCGDDCPVENVIWNDAQEFIGKLNQKERTSKYRLPTEAEWEYTARAGTTTPFYTGNCISTNQANYDGDPLPGCSKGESHQRTIRVKSFSPNAFGLYDMHGNVWEWCQDVDGDYPSGSVTDPTGPSSGDYRVVRGGSWSCSARLIRAANRWGVAPSFHYARDINIGFRVARDY